LSVGVQFLFHGAAILVGVAVYNLNLRRLTELFHRGVRVTAPEATGNSTS
jgi:hypothetical protein